MPDFSTILQTPEIRALVQENILERAFHDALFPRLLFRGEASPVEWPANVGDRMIFTGTGLIPVDLEPLTPGQDPIPASYTAEQWDAQLDQYANTIDTHMPTSIVAIANLFYRNAQQLGLNAGQSLNRLVRDRIFNAAESGWTVAAGAQVTTATLAVKRLNGFTTARRPDLPDGSPVRFDQVSSSNPLTVTILTTTGPVQRTVTGYTPTTAGDQIGPGTLTLTGGVVTVDDRAYVISYDRTFLVRSGGGLSVDAVGPADLLRMQDIRSMVSRFRQANVPFHADGRYHAHIDPQAENGVYSDQEWQRLNTALPDYYMYRDFAIGEIQGTVFFRNSENPQPDTVRGGATATFTQKDPFAGELYNDGTPTGMPIHRTLFVAQGGVLEYYQNLAQLITEAGVTGRVGAAAITNNGIEVNTDRIQLLIRSPLNRLQDKVATSWKFIGDWPVRTDAATGDDARYKRVGVIQSAGA